MQLRLSEIKKTEPLREHGDITDLKNSIIEVGLINPISIDQDYNLLAGRRRFQAITEIGWESVDVRIIDTDSPLKSFKVALDENLKRKPLSDPEVSIAIAEYDEMARQIYGEHPQGKHSSLSHYDNDGWTQQQTADTLGISRPTVVKAIDIKKAIDEYPELLTKDSGQAVLVEYKNIKHRKRVAELTDKLGKSTPESTNGLYDVIVVDPPWPYGTEYDSQSRRVGSPYPEMSLVDIESIELPSTNDCVLWLWTTHKFLRDAFGICENWGFRDVAILTWVKNRMGIGHWLRSKSEFCIMAIKGHPLVNLTNQTTILEAPLREHSRKPDEFYKMVDDLCIGRKIDWFSREAREGWDQFGIETTKFMGNP